MTSTTRTSCAPCCENADNDLLPFVALAGLAGLRQREIVRLTWEDVFRVPGHIEVGALKTKTRSRRLGEIVPALAAWLEPYRGRTGPVWTNGYNASHVEFAWPHGALKIPRRRNGPRHAFVAAQFAARAGAHPTQAFEPALEGAPRRHLRAPVLLAELVMNFLGPPGRTPPAPLTDELNPTPRQSGGRAVRTARLIAQTRPPAPQKSRPPFGGGFPADAEAAADGLKRLTARHPFSNTLSPRFREAHAGLVTIPPGTAGGTERDGSVGEFPET